MFLFAFSPSSSLLPFSVELLRNKRQNYLFNKETRVEETRRVEDKMDDRGGNYFSYKIEEIEKFNQLSTKGFTRSGYNLRQ